MSEDPDVFLNYVETSQERERVLALLNPDVRAVVEQYMAKHRASVPRRPSTQPAS